MTEVEDTRRWSWGVLPHRHESQELRKTFRGTRVEKNCHFPCHVRASPGVENSRLGRKGSQLRKSVTQQPSVSLDRGGHKWRRGRTTKEPGLA